MRRLINEKLLKELSTAIALVNSLDNVQEFEELEHRKLFEDPPQQWTNIELAISIFLARKDAEIMEAVKKVLLKT